MLPAVKVLLLPVIVANVPVAPPVEPMSVQVGGTAVLKPTVLSGMVQFTGFADGEVMYIALALQAADIVAASWALVANWATIYAIGK